MKKILLAMACAVLFLSACEKPVEKPEWFTNASYFEEKNGMYEEIPVCPGNIVMVGDDYIDRGIWSEFYSDTTFKNRGITYDATEHVLYRIERIAAGKPYKIFVSAGLNDLLHGTEPEAIVANIEQIFKRAERVSPDTKYSWLNIVLSPVLDEEQKARGEQVNDAVMNLAKKVGFEYIDINSALQEGIENGTYSWDGGKFLNGAGYEAYAKAIEKQVDREAKNAPKDEQDALEVSDYYKHRVSIFRSLPETKGQIVMLGNSLNNNALWTELFPTGHIVNRGISGDVVAGVEQRLEEIVADKPAKIFLITATNDFINDPEIQAVDVWEKYEHLIKMIRFKMPVTRLYVQSTLPLNPKTKFYEGFNERAAELNKLLAGAADRYGYIYLDIASLLSDENGDLEATYTTDGIHLSATGYFVWAAELAKGTRMITDL